MTTRLSVSTLVIFIFAGQLLAQTKMNSFVFQTPAQTSKTICFQQSNEVPFEQIAAIMDNNESNSKELEFTTRTLTGQVFDFSGAELVGAEIGFQLAPFHAITDKKGKYAITIPRELKQLSFAEDGMDGDYVDVKQTDVLNVLLLNNGSEGIDQMFEAVQFTQPSSRKFAIKVSGSIKVNGKAKAGTPYVRIEGTNTKVFANAAGNFDIMAPPGHDILSFECENFPARKVILPDVQTVYIPANLWPSREEIKKEKILKKNKVNF